MTSQANLTRDDTGKPEEAKDRLINLDAKPEAITLDPTMTAVIVVDMQNDFGSKGGMFDRAGIDISGIEKVVGPTAKVLAAARKLGIKIIYLKMGYKPDLSDLGTPKSVNRVRHRRLGVGDYLCILLADCMSEPIGHGLPRSNHDASLLNAEMALGWVSDSERILKAVQP
jgi:isochorismatase family protein